MNQKRVRYKYATCHITYESTKCQSPMNESNENHVYVNEMPKVFKWLLKCQARINYSNTRINESKDKRVWVTQMPNTYEWINQIPFTYEWIKCQSYINESNAKRVCMNQMSNAYDWLKCETRMNESNAKRVWMNKMPNTYEWIKCKTHINGLNTNHAWINWMLIIYESTGRQMKWSNQMTITNKQNVTHKLPRQMPITHQINWITTTYKWTE